MSTTTSLHHAPLGNPGTGLTASHAPFAASSTSAYGPLIWNHRHDVVFLSETPSLLRLRRRCREDVRLWRCRLRGSETRSSEILSLGHVLSIVFYLQVLFVSYCCSSIQIQYKYIRWGPPHDEKICTVIESS